jgi:hypothetical protein
MVLFSVLESFSPTTWNGSSSTLLCVCPPKRQKFLSCLHLYFQFLGQCHTVNKNDFPSTPIYLKPTLESYWSTVEGLLSLLHSLSLLSLLQKNHNICQKQVLATNTKGGTSDYMVHSSHFSCILCYKTSFFKQPKESQEFAPNFQPCQVHKWGLFSDRENWENSFVVVFNCM